MLKLKRLSILLVVAVTVLLGVVSCTQGAWGSYALNNRVTMDYPSGWLVDYFDGSGNPTARFMFPEGDNTNAHTIIWVILEEWELDDFAVLPTELSNGTRYVGTRTDWPEEYTRWEGIYICEIGDTSLRVESRIPAISEVDSPELEAYILHMIASMEEAR